MAIDVRRATGGDAAAVEALAERAVRAAYRGVLVRAGVRELVEAGFLRAPIDEVLADDGVRVYLAEDGDELAGYATVDEPDGGVADLQVHVDPGGRGGGAEGDRVASAVADRLLDRVEADLPAGTRLRARVLAGDVAGNGRLSGRFEVREEAEIDLGGDLQRVVVYERTVG